MTEKKDDKSTWAPVPPGMNISGYNHQLGECGVSFFATPTLAAELIENFPQSLNAAAMLMPGESTAVHDQLNKWFDKLHVHPRIVGEFDDSALMKAFGQAGTGVFIAPTPIAREIEKQYGVVVIGQTEEVREQFYAISVERKISHPAVVAITEAAREWLFRQTQSSSR